MNPRMPKTTPTAIATVLPLPCGPETAGAGLDVSLLKVEEDIMESVFYEMITENKVQPS